MDIHRPKEKLTILVVFLLPLLLVKGGGLVTGSGPAKAHAGPKPKNAAPKIAELPGPPEWAPEQLVAAQHIELLKSKPFSESPLFHAAPPPPPDQRPVQPVQPRQEVPPPDVRVKMILTRSDGNHVALIDRKRYVVGDPIGDKGWYIIKIDGPARAVMIEHRPSERIATLTVPLPR
jgi:hypothetical protein